MSEAKHGTYRWEQCYELDEGVFHWAIVDDESEAKRSVCSHLLVVNHEWADSLGTPFPECELPKRVVECLNACEGINPAAVRDLLAACKAASEHVCSLLCDSTWKTGNNPKHHSTCKMIRDAIQEAGQ